MYHTYIYIYIYIYIYSYSWVHDRSSISRLLYFIYICEDTYIRTLILQDTYTQLRAHTQYLWATVLMYADAWWRAWEASELIRSISGRLNLTHADAPEKHQISYAVSLGDCISLYFTSMVLLRPFLRSIDNGMSSCLSCRILTYPDVSWRMLTRLRS